MSRRILKPWKLFTSQRCEGLKTRRTGSSVEPRLEVLEDRSLPSVSVPTPLADVPWASSSAAPQATAVTSQMASTMNQWGQQIATIQQELLSVWNGLAQLVAQDMAYVQLQLDHLLGINATVPNQSLGTSVSQTFAAATPIAVHPRGGLLVVNIAIPTPVPNPLTCTVTVSGCNNPTVTASLTDGDGNETNGTVTADPPPPPPPSSSQWAVSFPALPAGDYTLSIQVSCDGSVVNQSQGVTLPAPP